MDFNRKIYELNSQKLNYINLNKGIEREKERQLEEFKKELDLKYQDKIKFNQEKIDEISKEELKYCKIVEYYSLFNAENISDILINLINVFSGKEFICTTIPVYKDSKLQISKPVKILINKEYVKHYFLVKNIVDLINQGKAIILDENQNISGILFYRYNQEKNTINPNINLEKFPYLKEFIDSVISYRIERNVIKISSDMLETLKLKFISSKTSKLKTNYDLDKKIESLNKKGEIPQIKKH